MKTDKTEVVEKTKTESDKIWEQLSNLKLDLFGLPNQILANNATRIVGAPDEVLLKLKVSAVLPALEQALVLDGNGKPLPNPKFKILEMENYISIKRA